MTAGFTALLFVVFGVALALGGWATPGSDAPSAAIVRRAGTCALVLAVVNLFVLPFGTALAIYTFWVLLHNEARALFEPSTS